MVLMETPSNPLMRAVDVRSIARRARGSRQSGRRQHLLVPRPAATPASGSTFRRSFDHQVSQRPFRCRGGAVACADKADAEALAAWANITGVTGSAFDSYLTLRGVRTLFPRVERQQETALAIAKHLSAIRRCRVHYPGLPSHPGHALAKVQQLGFGAMLSFELSEAPTPFGASSARCAYSRSPSRSAALRVLAHPVTMTHASMDAEARGPRASLAACCGCRLASKRSRT